MNKTMKCIKELQRKKAKGQKSVNVMGKRLDIDEAIGHLIDEEMAWKDYQSNKQYIEDWDSAEEEYDREYYMKEEEED